MKKLLKGLLILGVLGTVGVALVFYLTSGATTAADQFFQAVREQNQAQASQYLSEDFKSRITDHQMQALLNHTILKNYADASWGNRKMTGGKTTLEGTVTSSTGGVVPITLTLVKENDAWKIYDLQYGSSDTTPSTQHYPLPTPDQQVGLVRGAVNLFTMSISQQSMALFYSQISEMWRKQTSVDALNKGFAEILPTKDKLLLLNQGPPARTEVKQNQDGSITIDGDYELKNRTVAFELDFVMEHTAWRLIGFRINIKKSESSSG